MTTSNLNSCYTYRVSIKGNGGEFVLGGISTKASSYWARRPHDELSEYIANPDGSRFEPSNDEYQLPSWHEIDSFAHEYGVEHIEEITVENPDGEEILRLDGDSLKALGLVQYGVIEDRSSLNEHDGDFLFSRTFEKGYCTFLLQTPDDFNIDRLKLIEVDIWDREIINDLFYDGERLEIEEQFGGDYADLEATITKNS